MERFIRIAFTTTKGVTQHIVIARTASVFAKQDEAIQKSIETGLLRTSFRYAPLRTRNDDVWVVKGIIP